MATERRRVGVECHLGSGWRCGLREMATERRRVGVECHLGSGTRYEQRTDRIGGRPSAASVQDAPPSAEPKTAPCSVPK
jgi:hypothetical protein